MKRNDNRQPTSIDDDIQVGDTVKLKNSNHKHKATDIYLVTDTKREDVTVQRILHPLTDIPTKLMSKPYVIKAKLLKPIHQPRLQGHEDNSEKEENKTKCKSNVKTTETWNPFNQNFYYDKDSDDEEPQQQLNRRNKQTKTLKIETLHEDIPFEDEEEFEWDHSTEQLLITEQRSHDENADVAGNSQGTIIAVHKSDGKSRIPQLRRKNAIRRKQHPLRYRTTSPQRRNGSTLGNSRQAFSNPTSQKHLSNLLRPNNPIVPEAVQLGSKVQNVNRVLQFSESVVRKR